MPHALVEGFLSLLAPPLCPACNLAVPLEVIATSSASRRAEPPRHAEQFCPACLPLLEPTPAWLTPPARTAAVFRYEGPIADAIRRFKYAGAGRLAGPLGALLAVAARPYLGVFEGVVPLPLHPAKLRARGYNPAALLARPVARELGLPLRVDALRRDRQTRSQAGLDRDARLANLRGAFRAADLPPAKLLLIDDVRTTGATLAEAAATLAARGHEIATLTLAWAEA